MYTLNSFVRASCFYRKIPIERATSKQRIIIDIQDTYSIVTHNETSIEKATLESKKENSYHNTIHELNI